MAGFNTIWHCFDDDSRWIVHQSLIYRLYIEYCLPWTLLSNVMATVESIPFNIISCVCIWWCLKISAGDAKHCPDLFFSYIKITIIIGEYRTNISTVFLVISNRVNCNCSIICSIGFSNMHMVHFCYYWQFPLCLGVVNRCPPKCVHIQSIKYTIWFTAYSHTFCIIIRTIA